MTLREATLYREAAGAASGAATVTLTKGQKVREPQVTLRGKMIDVLVGHLWISDLPDITKNSEAYLEINVVAKTGEVEIPNPFKLQIDVRDKSFSANIQGAEIITGARIIGNGLEFQCRLTELDRIDKSKFDLMKRFVDDNDIPGVAGALFGLQGAPINPKEAIKILFNAVELLDGLNDDDRVWLERPKLDLRSGTINPLYEGWYALVTTPKAGSTLPTKLQISGGILYESYISEDDNRPFRAQSYLTWQFIASTVAPLGALGIAPGVLLNKAFEPADRGRSVARAKRKHN